MAVLHDPADRSNVLLLKGLQEAAPALGLTLQPLEVRELGEFEGAFIAMSRERADALFGAPGVLTFEHQKTVVGLAAKSRITDAVGPSPVCGCRRPDVLRGELLRPVSTRRDLRGSDSQGGQAGRPARAAADQVRVHSQSQDRQGAWPYRAADAARPRRRGDRIGAQCPLLAQSGHP